MPRKSKRKDPDANHDEIYQVRLRSIKDHPEFHKHDFMNLQSCCYHRGAIDLGLMEAHSQFVDMGSNGGVPCDTRRGPCNCGAWH